MSFVGNIWSIWVIGAIFLWIFCLLIFTYNGVFQQEMCRVASQDKQSCGSNLLKDQIIRISAELLSLKAENAQLKKLVQRRNLKLASKERQSPFNSRQKVDPMKDADEKHFERVLFSKEHELARRQLHNDILELYFYVARSPEVNGSLRPEQRKRINNQTIEQEEKRLDAWIPHIGRFRTLDITYSQLRKISYSKLITTLVNSMHLGSVDKTDDWHRRLLICNLNEACGFGCQLHYLSYCFIVAAASNRTMVLENDGRKWQYHSQGWNAVFKPITSCSFAKDVGVKKCFILYFAKDVSSKDHSVPWTSLTQSARIVQLRDFDVLRSVSLPQLPLSFPAQFADILLTHHSHPPSFFIGQFLWYLMRENDPMKRLIAGAESKIPFNMGPVVGLHVRRTDKIGTEAALHELGEYMEWAEFWFRVEERKREKQLKRRVFIATDDPTVIKEAKEKYNDYEVYANVANAKKAQPSGRYSDSSLVGILTDIRLLSNCDFIVCTFSSQVDLTRSYELMQVLRGDMAERAHSLDDIFYFGGQHAHELVATQSYNATNNDEIDLEVGDVIGIAGNHWNGFSKGTNRRTQMTGLFPSYMAREKWRIVDFPLFNN